jgi:hypothetical protein
VFVRELKPKPGGDHKVSCEKVKGTDAVRGRFSGVHEFDVT